jgi:hypothetical protein
MRIRVCYLDCHESGLDCYLVIYIEKLLRLLQLFYFHLWPIYRLCLVLVSYFFPLSLCIVFDTVHRSNFPPVLVVHHS